MFSNLIDSIQVGLSAESFRGFFENLSISSVVMLVLMVFMVVGLIDKLRGNKKGYGERFDAGFLAMGDLALAVVGFVSLSPVLLLVLEPLVTPIYRLLGASPAMFPSSLIAVDMGGYVMSLQLAGEARAVGQYSGLIVASMMGITTSFTIPFALRMMKKEDQPILGAGILIGVITMPIGCIIGGLLMNMTSTPLTIRELFFNTLPVLIFAVVIALGLFFIPKGTMKAFVGFGKVVTFLVTVAPAIAIFQYITGIRLPLFYKMVEYDPVLDAVPLEMSLLLVGQIAIVLAGAFPMIHFLNRSLAKPMERFGKKVGINTESSSGLLTQLASSIPIFGVIDTMNDKGKLINIAFAVSGSFVLGDVLAFVGGAMPEMVFPVIAAKLTAGIAAIFLAAALSKNGRLIQKKKEA